MPLFLNFCKPWPASYTILSLLCANFLSSSLRHLLSFFIILAANTIDSQSHVYGSRNVHYVVPASEGDWQQRLGKSEQHEPNFFVRNI